MLVDYVAGHLGGPEEVKMAAKIARVIVAGGCRTAVDFELLKGNKLTPQAQRAINGPLHEVDALLSVLASSVPVDVSSIHPAIQPAILPCRWSPML